MNDSVVTYALEEQIGYIGLNRLDKRNAMNEPLVRQLAEAVERACTEARAAVLFSHGEHFCSGLDLREALQWIKDPKKHTLGRRGAAARPFDDVARAPIPFIAAISGACVGGGFELAAACHLRVADDTAFFALPEGQRAIFVGGGGSVRIARLIGAARMLDLMLTGRGLSASEAERFNAVQYVVSTAQHRAEAKRLALLVARNASMTNWAVINGIPRIQDLSQDDGLFVEGLLATAVGSPESVQELEKFLAGKASAIGKPER